MSSFRRFEEMDAWKQSRELARQIYHHTGQGALGNELTLKEQLRQAATSIMTNIAEGYVRSNRDDFIRFLTVANGACAKIRSLLIISQDQDFIALELANQLQTETDEVGRRIGGLIRYLHNTPPHTPKPNSQAPTGQHAVRQIPETADDLDF